jgi:hypothetical protein
LNRTQFQALPWLLLQYQVQEATGYDRSTLSKLIDCGVLEVIRSNGCRQTKLRKIQIAKLLKLEDWLDRERWEDEPHLMTLKAVCHWTGYSVNTIHKMVRGGELDLVRPAGIEHGRYRKRQIAELLGL